MKNTIKKSIIIVILISSLFILILPSTFADYPIIISNQGVNHTQAKQLVYSIPEEYYKYVNVIEFVKGYAHEKIIDKFVQKKVWKGWYWVYWNKNHECFNGKIILSEINRSLLIHELGHIEEHCLLKKDISTEEFADNFKIKK